MTSSFKCSTQEYDFEYVEQLIKSGAFRVNLAQFEHFAQEMMKYMYDKNVSEKPRGGRMLRPVEEDK